MTARRRARRWRCAQTRLAAAIVAGSLATATAREAHATPSAKLVYVRGPETAACPDETQLRRAVATRIGYDPFFATASKTVIAQISRAKTGYRGKIQIIGDDGVIRGERELATRGDDCSELISALALAVSIALDDLDDGAPAPATAASAPGTAAPDGLAASDASDAAPRPPTEPTSPGVTAPSAADDGARPAPPSSSSSRLGVAVSAGPVVSLGAAPGPSVGGAIAATMRYRWAALRVDLRADLPASGDLGGGGRVTASSLVGTAALCARGDVPFVCAGGGLGSFATTTDSISRPASDHALLLEVLAVAGADISVSRQLFVEPFTEIGLVLTRHRVFVDGIEGYRLPAVVATAGIHLGWRFL